MSSTLERDNVQAVNHLVHRVIRGALPRFSGVRGIEIPRNRFFSCTVNGTFSFWRDKKRMWGWNCGFRKMPRYDWQRAVRTKYVKRISALRTNLFCRSLRRGTFHRRKVPKDRWGVSMRPRPLATPQAPEGSQQSAPRCAVRSYEQTQKNPRGAILAGFYYPIFRENYIMLTALVLTSTS